MCSVVNLLKDKQFFLHDRIVSQTWLTEMVIYLEIIALHSQVLIVHEKYNKHKVAEYCAMQHVFMFLKGYCMASLAIAFSFRKWMMHVREVLKHGLDL